MPSREDFLTQIDADRKAKAEPDDVLAERRKRVAAAKSDEAAARAYNDHVAEVRSPPE